MTKKIEKLVNKFNEQNGEINDSCWKFPKLDCFEMADFWREVVHQRKVESINELYDKGYKILNSLYYDGFFDCKQIMLDIFNCFEHNTGCGVRMAGIDEIIGESLVEQISDDYAWEYDYFVEDASGKEVDAKELYKELSMSRHWDWVIKVCSEDFTARANIVRDIEMMYGIGY